MKHPPLKYFNFFAPFSLFAFLLGSPAPAAAQDIKPVKMSELPINFGSYYPTFTDIDGNGCLEPVGALSDCENLYFNDVAEIHPLEKRKGNYFVDLNGDGIDDLIVSYYGPLGPNVPNHLHIYLGRGNGKFVPAPDDIVSTGLKNVQGRTETIGIFDANNDGNLDFFIPAYTFKDVSTPNRRTSYFFLNNGRGRFEDIGHSNGTALDDLPMHFRAEGAAAVDFNFDGKLDIITGSKILINDGNANFTDKAAMYGYPKLFEEGLVVADLNNTGSFDIATMQVEGYGLGGNRASIYLYWNNAKKLEKEKFGNVTFSYGLVGVDLNFDGLIDLAYFYTGQNSEKFCGLRVLLNQGNNKFIEQDFPSSQCPTDISGAPLAAGDFNSDGKIDLAVITNVGMKVFRNDTPGTANLVAVDLLDEKGRRNQQGRTLWVNCDGREYVRRVDAPGGYLSQNQYRIYVYADGCREMRLRTEKANFSAKAGRIYTVKGKTVSSTPWQRNIRPLPFVAKLQTLVGDVPDERDDPNALINVVVANAETYTSTGSEFSDTSFSTGGGKTARANLVAIGDTNASLYYFYSEDSAPDAFIYSFSWQKLAEAGNLRCNFQIKSANGAEHNPLAQLIYSFTDLSGNEKYMIQEMHYVNISRYWQTVNYDVPEPALFDVDFTKPRNLRLRIMGPQRGEIGIYVAAEGSACY